MSTLDKRNTEYKKAAEKVKTAKEQDLTEDLCIKAVSYDWKIIRVIPELLKTKKVCENAIKANYTALKYCPENMVSKELYLQCISEHWQALKYLSIGEKTLDICKIAIAQNYRSLQFVPQNLISEELCLSCLKSNLNAFQYMPERYRTPKNYLFLLNEIEFSPAFKKWLGSNIRRLDDSFYQFLEQKISLKTKNSLRKEFETYKAIKNIATLIQEIQLFNLQIAKKERSLNLRRLVNSWYDKDEQMFNVCELFCKERQIRKFVGFQEFYDYLEGNLRESNLTEYDFEQIEMEKFNLDGAYLSSKMLIKQGKYDKSFYEKTVSTYIDDVSFLPVLCNEKIPAYTISHEEIVNDKLNSNDIKIYYISDIHINHRLLKAFPSSATQDEIRFFIKKMVRKMVPSTDEKHDSDYLLIAGDVSFCFDISKIFYTELSKLWEPSHVIIILGNHELWDFNRFGRRQHSNQDLQIIINQYRKFFKSLHITFLHNELLLLRTGYYDSSKEVISEKDILQRSIEELRNSSIKTNLIILGGLGFSGYDSTFNAATGIYRQTISTLEEDIFHTTKFEKVYKKLLDAYAADKVIVLTHTPKNDWTKLAYNPNWIYVNGHTHKNTYTSNDHCTLYADNQIGYTAMSIGLKYFKMSGHYDTFKYFVDGIYEITRDQYLEFNYGIKIHPTFNRNTGVIIMLKRQGVYCFLFRRPDKNKLYLLNGGLISNLKKDDITYYYDNIVKYADFIKAGLKSYNEALKSISIEIKKIGGIGTVHGCIVDIDFYNHIYLNPYDGTIKAYYSPCFGVQRVYSDILKLLIDQCPILYQNYEKLISNSKNAIINSSADIQTTQNLIFGTAQYKPSRLIKSLQYVTENNVIRIWSDDFISSEKINESNYNLLTK